MKLNQTKNLRVEGKMWGGIFKKFTSWFPPSQEWGVRRPIRVKNAHNIKK